MPRTLKWQTVQRIEWLLNKYGFLLLARTKLQLFSIVIPHMTFYIAGRNPNSDPCDCVVSTLLAELLPKPVSVFLFITSFLDRTPSLNLKLFKLFLLISYLYKREAWQWKSPNIEYLILYDFYFFYFPSKMWRKKYK